MKLGLFADIHGNGRAFEEVCRILEKEQCDAWIFLGDICGYYYDQKAVIDRLRQTPCLYAVQGNHDALFLESLNNPLAAMKYTRRYGRSFECLKDTITPEQIEFLACLPESLTLEECDLLACHGAPWDPLYTYIYPDADFQPFDGLGKRYVLLGHTHHVMEIRRGAVSIINPGSAGQPRDGGWASFALLETETGALDVRRIEFDVRSLMEDVKRRKEMNPYLIDALLRIKDPA